MKIEFDVQKGTWEMSLLAFVEAVHRQATRSWAMSAEKLGITYSEFEYLRAIKAQEASKTDEQNHGQHLQDVVDEMGIRKASASAMVLKLEERGLVNRFPCQFDARAQHIILSDQGEKLLGSAESVYRELVTRLEAQFSPADFEQLSDAVSSFELPKAATWNPPLPTI